MQFLTLRRRLCSCFSMRVVTFIQTGSVFSQGICFDNGTIICLYLIDLLPELFSDFCLLGLEHLAHDRDYVLAPLGLGICSIQVVKRDVLDNLFLLVNVSLQCISYQP